MAPCDIRNRNIGGMQIQVYRTKEELERLGYEVEFFKRELQYSPNQYICGHVFFAGVTTYYESLALQEMGIPFVLSTIHLRGVSLIDRFKYKYLNLLIAKLPFNLLNDTICGRKQVRLAKKILPNTYFENSYCIDVLGANPANSLVMPNGIDTHWLEERHAGFVDSAVGKEPFLLCVGRINDNRKHFDLVAEVCINLKLKCVLAGSWDEKQSRSGRKIKELTMQHPEYIKYLGMLPNGSSRLAELYQKCKVFALPSDFETPGLAALEAGYAGANIVITNVGGTYDYFKEEVFYVKPNDERALEEAIALALQKPKNDNLKNIIMHNYTWERVAKLTSQVYERIYN